MADDRQNAAALAAAPTGTSTRRTISPYDLTSSDNPGAIISQPLLNGQNYDEWAINLRVALSCRKKFGFIDGTIPKPTDDSSDLEDWRANNHLLVTWIKLTIEPKLRTSISHKEIAKDLWDHIKRRFAVKSGARYQQLRGALATCRQSGSTVDDYFGRLTKIWDAMVECLSTKVCSCNKCECDLGTAHETERDILRVHDFLYGLDDSIHGAVRSQICAQAPLPNLDTVYQIIVQNETVQANARQEAAIMSFNVQTQASRRPNDNNAARQQRPVTTSTAPCTSCGRLGHEATMCFRVIGFPPWWGDRPRNRINVQAANGGTTGRGRGSAPRANVTQIIGDNPVQANLALTDADRQGLTGFSDEQWKILKSMFPQGSTSEKERLSGKNDELLWVLDTGATHHMTGRLDCLFDLRDITPVPVTLAAGKNAMACIQGTAKLTSRLVLTNVYYIDGFNTNLISFGQLVTDNFAVGQVTDKLVVLQDRITRTLIGAGKREGEGLYHFKGIETVAALQTSVGDDGTLWHRRMGHPSSLVVKMLTGVGVKFRTSCFQFSNNCEVCLQAKQTRQPFPISSNRANKPFDLIHCDLWGPYRTSSTCGSRYFLTIVDDYSRAVWLYLMSDKTNVSTHLRQFISLSLRQFEKKVKVIRSDNGTEFMCLSQYFLDQGILHETSCVATPQQNGRVERKHQHILNVARALRFQAGLPIDFWAECALTSCYLINRTPSKLLDTKTPFELLYGHPPSLAHLRVFGCLCYAHNLDHKGDKFAPRSRKCVFMGYPYGKKAWRLYDLDLEKFFSSRDVVFLETEFPFHTRLTTRMEDNFQIDAPTFPHYVDDTEILPSSQVPTITPPTNPESETGLLHDLQPSPHIDSINQSEQLGRGLRSKIPSVRLKDYVVSTIKHPSPSLTSLTSLSPQPASGTAHPIANYHNCDRFSTTHCRYLVALTAAVEPRSYKEAMNSEDWTNAMSKEITALEDNKTWDLEELPPGKKALGSKWVFRIKLHADGTIERYKARLVVLGNNQTEGEDYSETYAPVAKMTTVRMFLDLVAKRNYEVHQMDVHNAFLHGDLKEEVYMRLPLGFRSSSETRVCRLRKSLYGLKQAPRCWFAKLTTALTEFGFVQTRADYSLFVYLKNGTALRVLVYVDDLIISGNDPLFIQEFKDFLSTKFHMKDLGILKYFLGLEVARNADGIYLCQRKYCFDIITEAGLLGCSPAGSPIDQNQQLALVTSPDLPDPTAYRRLVGRLVYLKATRPDLSFSIHVLSQFVHQPKEAHWEAVLKVVRYLKGTIGQGILLRANSPIHLTGWCDAAYSSCPLSRRSVTGYLVQLGTSPISWKTRKQPTVSRSSAEAEYRAMADLAQELRWLKSLLSAFGFQHDKPMTLRCDSKAALHISANPVFHERTKHIENDCHFVRDDVMAGTIVTQHVASADQLADILTKALGRKEFDNFLLKLGIHNLYAPT